MPIETVTVSVPVGYKLVPDPDYEPNPPQIETFCEGKPDFPPSENFSEGTISEPEWPKTRNIPEGGLDIIRVQSKSLIPKNLSKPGWTTSEFIGLMLGLVFNIFVGIISPMLNVGDSQFAPIAAVLSQGLMQYSYGDVRKSVKLEIANLLKRN